MAENTVAMPGLELSKANTRPVSRATNRLYVAANAMLPIDSAVGRSHPTLLSSHQSSLISLPMADAMAGGMLLA